MHLFYLNECLGSASYGIDDLSVGLVTVVQAFNKLANVPKLKIEKGWVIEKNPSEMYLGGVKLQDIVNKMRDKESKRLFFIYCTNYPIHTFFPQVDDDELLEADYRLDGADALNIALAVNNNGILLTLPVAECLKQNTIVINSNHDGVKSLSALNLHGSSEDNVVFISRKILDRNYSAGDGLDKLANLALEAWTVKEL